MGRQTIKIRQVDNGYITEYDYGVVTTTHVFLSYQELEKYLRIYFGEEE